MLPCAASRMSNAAIDCQAQRFKSASALGCGETESSSAWRRQVAGSYVSGTMADLVFDMIELASPAWTRTKSLMPTLNPQAGNRGSALLTALIFTGVMVAVVGFALQRSGRMIALTKSTLLASDLAAIERVIVDNVSCRLTLGPAPICPQTFTLKDANGAAITDAAQSIGNYKLTATCTSPTPSDPNKRLVIMAQSRKPDPLLPNAPAKAVQLFKEGQTYKPSYPCVKYMNVGPQFMIPAPTTVPVVAAACDCAAHVSLKWCHYAFALACPAGYVAAAPGADCSYNDGTGFIKGEMQAASTTGANGFVDCCAPKGAKPNPAFVVCIRN